MITIYYNDTCILIIIIMRIFIIIILHYIQRSSVVDLHNCVKCMNRENIFFNHHLFN